MAFDDGLAGRMRTILENRDDVAEQRMFGGLCFLVRGHMACGVVGAELMVRVGPESYEEALAQPHARPMDFTGRPLRGMVYVGEKGRKRDAALRAWIARGVRFATSLPAKSRRARAVTATKNVVVISPNASRRAPAKKATSKKATSKKATPKKATIKKEDLTKAEFRGFPKATFAFLRGIAAHNDKAWLDAHRPEYEEGYVEAACRFIEAMGPRLQQISRTVRYAAKVNGSLMRIHRDVRFSKDKSPYKPHLDMWFWHGDHKGFHVPSFFLRLTDRRLTIGSGIHHFDKPTLARYRDAVTTPKSGTELARILAKAQSAGYTIGGATRTKVPRGFDSDHPQHQLLLHEGLTAMFDTKVPAQAYSAALVEWCAAHFAATWPVTEWLLRGVAPVR